MDVVIPVNVAVDLFSLWYSHVRTSRTLFANDVFV